MDQITAKLVKEQPSYAFSVGIDWADESHALCQRRWADGQRQDFKIPADPVSVQAWLSELKVQAGPQGRVLVGLSRVGVRFSRCCALTVTGLSFIHLIL